MNEISSILPMKKSLNVLITGATGFTGSALTKRLVCDGHCVRIIVRNSEKAKSEIFDKVEIISGDLTDESVINESMKGIDLVFHIAAVFREPGITDQVYWNVHVKATELLLNAALANGVKRFIHCSTGGVHGHITEPPAGENYRFAPGDIYQITKLEGEKKAFEFYNKTGFPVTVIRPSPIYGPGDLRLLKLFKLTREKFTVLIGNGKIYYHMVYIDDLVDAFILAANHKDAVGEAFLIAGEEVLNLNSLLDKISDNLHFSKKKIHLPAPPFQLAGSILESICIPLKINPPIYRRRVDFFTKSRYFDISKAKKVLGYQPKVGIDEGLKRTADWYRSNNLL